MSKTTAIGGALSLIPGFNLIGLPLLAKGIGEDTADSPDTPQPTPDAGSARERTEMAKVLRAASAGIGQTLLTRRGNVGSSSSATSSGQKATTLG